MHPVLFEIPHLGWPIFSYGVMLGISLIAGWYLTLALAERDGFSREAMANAVVISIVTALVSARLLYVLVNPGQFNSVSDLLNVRQGGLVAYGGFLGGFAASWVYCRAKKVRILAWADAAIPTLALGLFVTRIGCFLYGCDYGRRVTEADPGWLQGIAVRFPNWSSRFPGLGGGEGACSQDLHGSPAFAHHVADYGLAPEAAASLPVVPTQLISSANALVLLVALFVVRRYRTFRGQMVLFFGIYYGLTRFLIESVRDDTQRGGFGPAVFGPLGGIGGQLTTSQVVAVATGLASIAAWILLARRAKADPVAAMSLGEGAAAWRDDGAAGEAPRGRGRRRTGRRKGRRMS